jgi:hypothetical protein
MFILIDPAGPLIPEVVLKPLLVCRPRNNLQNLSRPCHFLKGDLNAKLPVTRYLEFNPEYELIPEFGCQSSQISGHRAIYG